jgi:hypothetical protein
MLNVRFVPEGYRRFSSTVGLAQAGATERSINTCNFNRLQSRLDGTQMNKKDLSSAANYFLGCRSWLDVIKYPASAKPSPLAAKHFL